MATTDSDHLPFRTVTGADSFDTWRRITNSIGRDSQAGAIESGHLYLDNFDWTARLVNPRGPEPLGGGHAIGDQLVDDLTQSELEALEAQTISDSGSLGNFNMAINGATDQAGVTLNPNSQQAYFDYANGGIRITGASNQWIRIKTRMPIDPNAQYRVKIRIKNLSPSSNSVDNRIQFGHLGLNSSFLFISTDRRQTANWIVTDTPLPSNSSGDQVTEYTNVLGPGFNPLYTEQIVDSFSGKFDPGSKYFDLILLNYSEFGDEWSSGNDIVIQGIEIERLPAGITITEHDDVDGVPRAKLQVGYQNEFTGYSNSNSTLFVNGDIQLTNGNNSDQTGRALIFNDSGTGFGVDHIFSSNNPTDSTSHDFHIVTTGRFRTGRGIGEKIFYRGRDFDIENSGGHHTNTTPGTGTNGNQFSENNFYSVLTQGEGRSGSVTGNQTDTFHPVADGEDTHKSNVHVGTIVAEKSSGTSTNVVNSMRAPLMIGRGLSHDGSEDGKIVPLLHLGVGSFRSLKSGGGPAINFHLPDLTGDKQMFKTNMALPYTHKVAQIACVKQSAFTAEDSSDTRDRIGVDERHPIGALVFRIGSNSVTNGTNGQGDQLVEAMRISSSDTNTVTKPTNIYMGLNPNNRPADLHVTGDIANIKGLDYKWPTTRTGGAAAGSSRVLASDEAGNLAWRTISTISVNQSVTTQSVTAPVGTIMAWAGHSSTIPNDFVECKGQTIGSISSSIIDNDGKSALLAVIGNKYGGNNTIHSTTGAKLPDLRKKVAVGRDGSNNFAVGDAGGAHNITFAAKNSAGTTTARNTGATTLTIAQIPDHQHYVASSGSSGTGTLTSSNQLESEFNVGEAGSQQSNANFEYQFHGTTSNANVGKSSTVIGANNQSHVHSIAALTVNLKSQTSADNANYQPYIAITYIMKVKADVVKGLDVSLGSFLDATTTEDHTGTKTDVLTFDSKSLRLAQYHPTWAQNRLNSYGYDFYLNTNANGGQANSTRSSGLAMAALGDRLEINYQGQLADRTRIGTTSNTRFQVQGNMGDGSSDHVISTAKYSTFDNLSPYSDPVASNLTSRTMTVNHENRYVTLDNTRLSDIDGANDQALVTKGYLNREVAAAVAVSNVQIARLVYNVSYYSPNGAYTSVERFSVSSYQNFARNGALVGDGRLYTHSGSNLRTLTAINGSRPEYFARVANGHPTLNMTIKIDFKFISNTDDPADHILSYRLKDTMNFLDVNQGDGNLVVVERRDNTNGDGGSPGQPNTWLVVRTVTNREIVVGPGQMIFFKFVGRIDSGSGQQEGVGIKGFNIHDPVWA